MNNRYDRQIALPEIGTAGQERLMKARVLLVGVGGLGSPISLYLTAAGVGTLGIMDDDVVSESNLQRQVLYEEAQVGQPKAAFAARRLQALNSGVKIVPYACRLTAENAEEIIRQYDIVVDGCDNFETRYLLAEVCARCHKPYVYGAIQGFNGQVAVFATDHHPVTYKDLYPEPMAVSPLMKAVIGTTPAIVGSVEANEVLKLIVGFGEPLYGKLWTIDLRNMQSFVIDL